MEESRILEIHAALANMGNDREIYDEVLTIFLEDTPVLLNKLQQAIETSDLETVSRLAHTLKSSSKTIGGSRFSAVAVRVEEAVHSHDQSLIKDLFTIMKSEFIALKKACTKNSV